MADGDTLDLGIEGQEKFMLSLGWAVVGQRSLPVFNIAQVKI